MRTAPARETNALTAGLGRRGALGTRGTPACSTNRCKKRPPGAWAIRPLCSRGAPRLALLTGRGRPRADAILCVWWVGGWVGGGWVGGTSSDTFIYPGSTPALLLDDEYRLGLPTDKPVMYVCFAHTRPHTPAHARASDRSLYACAPRRRQSEGPALHPRGRRGADVCAQHDQRRGGHARRAAFIVRLRFA